MSEIKLQENLFTVTTSPHIRAEASISKIMWSVSLALTPAALFAIYHFGTPALFVILAGSLSAYRFNNLCYSRNA